MNPAYRYSALIIDKLDGSSEYYTTTTMQSNEPFEFAEYEAVDHIPEGGNWGIVMINDSVRSGGGTQYILLRCQTCKTPLPFALRGQRGRYYFGKPKFMENWDIKCQKCSSGLRDETK